MTEQELDKKTNNTIYKINNILHTLSDQSIKLIGYVDIEIEIEISGSDMTGADITLVANKVRSYFDSITRHSYYTKHIICTETCKQFISIKHTRYSED